MRFIIGIGATIGTLVYGVNRYIDNIIRSDLKIFNALQGITNGTYANSISHMYEISMSGGYLFRESNNKKLWEIVEDSFKATKDNTKLKTATSFSISVGEV